MAEGMYNWAKAAASPDGRRSTRSAFHGVIQQFSSGSPRSPGRSWVSPGTRS
jgi:hypothetical protein